MKVTFSFFEMCCVFSQEKLAYSLVKKLVGWWWLGF